MKTIVHTTQAPAAIGPYSQANVLGNLIFTSGQLGVDPATGILPESLEEQCRNCFRNISNILVEGGSDLSKVLKTTVFISDMDDFTAINKIYAEFFTEPYPSRSCVQVARLPKNAKIEVEAIAYKE